MADEKIIIGISTEVDKSELDKAFKEVGKQVNKFNENDSLQLKIDAAITKLEDAKGITELKRNLKDLKGLALEVGDSNTEQFKRITDAIGKTNDKIGDLNSAIQSSSGEPIENLSKSFRGVGDSLRSLDFKSAKVQFNILTDSAKEVTKDLFGGIFALRSYRTALAEGATSTEALSVATKGFGKALAATGIGLIVIAVAALIANFDKLKESGGLIGKIFTKIGQTIDFVKEKLKAFSDALGLTDFAGQKQTEDLLKNLKKQEIAITESYDRIIAKKESEGKDTNRFEAGKTDALIKNLQAQEKVLKKSFAGKKELSDEEQTQLDELQSKIKNLQSERVVLDNEYRKHQKEKREEQKKEQEKQTAQDKKFEQEASKRSLELLDKTLQEEQKKKDDAAKTDEERRKQDLLKRVAEAEAAGKKMFEIDKRNADAKFNMLMTDKDKEYAALAEKLKKSGFGGVEIIKQQQVLLDEIYEEQRLKDLAREDLTLFEKGEINQKYDNLKEQNKKATQKRITDYEIEQINLGFETALRVADSINALSDLVFTIKKNNLEEGSEEEKRVAKEQFEFNKKLQIAVAVISGIQGVINAITAKSVIPEPFGTIQKVATAVTIAASTAANIAKISAQQFDGGKQTANTPTAPKPQPTQIGAGTSATIGRAQLKTRQDGLDYIKVNVTETDIRKVSTRVEVVENRSRIR
jgi:hypothetical protein